MTPTPPTTPAPAHVADTHAPPSVFPILASCWLVAGAMALGSVLAAQTGSAVQVGVLAGGALAASATALASRSRPERAFDLLVLLGLVVLSVVVWGSARGSLDSSVLGFPTVIAFSAVSRRRWLPVITGLGAMASLCSLVLLEQAGVVANLATDFPFHPYRVWTLALILVTTLVATRFAARRLVEALEGQERLAVALRAANESLEARVAERTAQLASRNDELAVALGQVREAMEELERSGRLASIGVMVTGVLHQLEGPVSNSLLASSALQARADDVRNHLARGDIRRSELQALLEMVEETCYLHERSLRRVIDQVGSLRQVSVDRASRQRRAFKLDELFGELDRALGPQLRRGGRRVDWACAEGLAMEGYPGALGEALGNLAGNAVLHGLHGRDDGRVWIQAEPAGDGRVRIEVGDDGNGIAPELRERVFDPFFSTRVGRGGSGVGLPVVRNIVVGLLGGAISLEDAPEGGTRFVIELPAHAPQRSDEEVDRLAYSVRPAGIIATPA